MAKTPHPEKDRAAKTCVLTYVTSAGRFGIWSGTDAHGIVEDSVIGPSVRSRALGWRIATIASELVRSSAIAATGAATTIAMHASPATQWR
jgi:hypothetical protein